MGTVSRGSRRWWLAAGSLLAVLGAWWGLTAGRVTFYARFGNLPTPAQVWVELSTLVLSPAYWWHIVVSIERVLLGFALALALGVAAGLSIGWSRPLAAVLFPPLELARPIPAIAWVPLSIMLWPTEHASIVYITMLGALFPIVLNTIAGVRAIERDVLGAASLDGASGLALFQQVVLPLTLPAIVTGATVGMGTSWLCLLAAEMISGQHGIGYMTWTAYELVKYPMVVAGMLTIGILGLGSSVLVSGVGRWLTSWNVESR